MGPAPSSRVSVMRTASFVVSPTLSAIARR